MRRDSGRQPREHPSAGSLLEMPVKTGAKPGPRAKRGCKPALPCRMQEPIYFNLHLLPPGNGNREPGVSISPRHRHGNCLMSLPTARSNACPHSPFNCGFPSVWGGKNKNKNKKHGCSRSLGVSTTLPDRELGS